MSSQTGPEEDIYDAAASIQREDRIKVLRKRFHIMKDYLEMRVEIQDWQGVIAAAGELRDIDAEHTSLTK